MRKALNNPIVVGVLCVIAVALVYWRASAPPAYLTEVDAGEIAQEPATTSEPELPVEVPERPPAPVVVASPANHTSFSSKEIIAQWEQVFSRDPFQGVAQARDTGEEEDNAEESRISADSLPSRNALQLQAVSVDGPRRFAVINHQIVAEGETVEGFQIKKIHGKGVVFTDRLGEHQLAFANQRKGDAS